MGRSKKMQILKTISVYIGCSSGCKKPNLSNIFNPVPKPRKTPKVPSIYNHCHSSPATPSPQTITATTITASGTSSAYSTTIVRGLGLVGGDSVAVEKDSDDPNLDFRQSMLQMILVQEIYSKDDLRELLSCFLQLNAPFYHGIIVRAFTEIWDGVFSSSATARRGDAASPWPFERYGPCVSRHFY